MKLTGSHQREDVSWFESAGVPAINDILYCPVTAEAQRDFSFLIQKALYMSLIPRGVVCHSGWVLGLEAA